MKPAHSLALAAILCLCATPLLSQDGTQIAPDPTKALLESLTEYDAKLAGELHYGVYLQGARSIGMMKVTVGKAPPEGKAVYRGELALDLSFGPSKVTENEVAMLNADLSVVSRSSVETNVEGETKVTENATVTLEDGKFVCKKSQDENEKTGTFKLPAEGPNHEGFISAILLTRSIDVTKPATYTFQEMVWPEIESETEPKTRDIVVSVPAAAEYEHRGKKLQAYQLRAKREGEGETIFVVDGDRRLLAFWPVDAPIKMVLAADAAEARKPLKEIKNVEPTAETPEGACAVYVLVLAKAKPTAALDSVMDWPALHSWLSTVNPGRWEKVPVDEFKDSLKAEFDALPAQFDKNVADQFIGMLTTKTQGDTAEVNGPGLPNPFHVKKQADGSWKITKFPAG